MLIKLFTLCTIGLTGEALKLHKHHLPDDLELAQAMADIEVDTDTDIGAFDDE